MRPSVFALILGLAVPVAATAAPPKPAPKPIPAKKVPPPVFAMKELSLRTLAQPTMPAIDRRVRIGLPKGWTGELEPDHRALRFYGPTGEGKILIAAALHPSELGAYLTELKNAHPSAAPSPPMPMDLPGIKAERNERATRFVITGHEVGEMVMIEKMNTIVLIVTVVSPDAWPEVQALMQKAYNTLEIVDVPPP